ncbi:hypothetical protein TFLX_05016 [Thermoflexales bacterium]|nr:hypothetical protein TFLX_05016 [Thermoflexales bacterium]
MRNFTVLLCAGLSLMLIGCGSDAPKQGLVDPPKEIFDAQMLTGLAPGARLEINSQIQNKVEVEVVVYPDDPAIPGNEVAVDYARTGWADGPDEDTAKEDASLEAENNLHVTLQAEHNTVKLHLKPGRAVPHVKDTVVLHVRVPPRTQIVVTLQSGNVQVAGDLTDVEVFTGNGNIGVRGATGSLTLKTRHGDIHVDDLRYQAEERGVLELEAVEGSIQIFAVNVSVSAQTTRKDIRFVGSLAEGPDNLFTTTDGGKITLALPDDLPYTFTAYGGKQVLNDFTAGTLVCGTVEGGLYDFHAQTTPSLVGHTSVGKWLTTTDYVSGTMIQNNYFLFHTNRSAVAKFLPAAGAPQQSGGTLWTSECDQPARQNAVAPIRFTVQTGKKGIIEVRLIRKH